MLDDVSVVIPGNNALRYQLDARAAVSGLEESDLMARTEPKALGA
jgi:hypothetical protein